MKNTDSSPYRDVERVTISEDEMLAKLAARLHKSTIQNCQHPSNFKGQTCKDCGRVVR